MSTPQFYQTGYLKSPNRSLFDMSHTHLTTTNFGKMNVVFSEEILPNDTWKVQQSVLARFQPILAPVMSRMDVKFYWFFTPNRLLYSDWENFISPNIEDTVNAQYDKYSQPVININSSFTPPLISIEHIIDYFESLESESVLQKDTARLFQQLGLPIWQLMYRGYDNDYPTYVSLLPFMAYQRIWYDYFRDENLDDATPIPTHGGIYTFTGNKDDLDILFKPRVKAWDKDYFTSALPFAQKGPTVRVPLGTSAEVSGGVTVPSPSVDIATVPEDGGEHISSYYYSNDNYREDLNNADTREFMYFSNAANTWLPCFPTYGQDGNIIGFVTAYRESVATNVAVRCTSKIKPSKNLYGTATSLTADLTNATATTIDMFETLHQLQRFFRRAASVGTRYVELLKGFFGVTPSDARLQRAEYLGGCKIPVISNEVFSNTETINSQDEIVNPVGSYAGKANAFGGDAPISRFFEEHGYLTCIMVVQPKTGYWQGLRRNLTERYDYTKFFWPQFAHLGEQEVKNREIYWNGTESDKDTFGYQSRYVEYKFIPDMISGDFQNGNSLNETAANMNFWHLFRNFQTAPNLNADFIHTDASAEDMKRIFAVTDAAEDSILCQIQFDCSAVRPMPVFAEPLLM